jgi:TatD DNase family protein
MMQLIDTHTHIYLPEFDHDRDEVVSRAVKNGVSILLMPNIDSESVFSMLAAQNRYPGICYPMIGLHPTSVKKYYEPELGKLRNIAANFKFIAIGEIGIDLHWDTEFISQQTEAFKKQVSFAVESELPVVIHSRNAFAEVFASLEEFRGSKLKGVFHAFSGTVEDAVKAIGMGFKLGIGGPLTFKNSKLVEVVKEAGLENIVLETDSPYLAPVPFRGKRNESSYISIINSKLAGIFEVPEEKTAAVTSENAVELFNLLPLV